MSLIGANSSQKERHKHGFFQTRSLAVESSEWRKRRASVITSPVSWAGFMPRVVEPCFYTEQQTTRH